MIQRIILVLIFVISSLSSIGQTYSGFVKDEHGKALVEVSIIVYDNKNNVLTYARSDSHGHFSLAVKEDSHPKIISFNIMGYARRTMPITNLKTEGTIVLTEKVFQVKEVRVKSQRLRSQGDTLTYSVAGFRQKQDHTIADVIAKMPGLQVRPNGAIQYQGKNINKFYIEGMDLLGGQYTQASENLSADKVASVQVLENHQPVKVLNGIKFSDQAALNLVLKDKSKDVWSGELSLGSGMQLQKNYNWLRDIKITEMLFSRKKQSISMYKHNNMGKDIMREVHDLAFFDQSAPIANGILSNIGLATTFLNSERSRFNDTHLFATNWLFKTKSNHDLRIQFSGLWDKSQQHQEKYTIYMDANSACISEEAEANSYRNEWKGEILYKVNDDKYYLSHNLRGYIDFNKSSGISILNQAPSNQWVTPRKRYLIDNLEYIKKNKRGQSISFASLFSYTYHPGKLLLATDSVETLSLKDIHWDAYAYYIHPIGSVKLSYKGGIKTLVQFMSTSQEDRYAQYQPYEETSISYNNGLWQINASCPISYLLRRYNHQGKSNFLLQPNIYAKYDINNSLQISVGYRYLWLPSDLKTTSLLPVYTTYITMMQGTGRLENTTSHDINLRLSYRNVMNGFFASLSASYSCIRNSLLYQSDLEGNIYIRKATGDTDNRESYRTFGYIGKAFGLGKVNIKIDGEYAWNHYHLLIDDRVTPQHSQFSKFSFSLSGRILQWFTFEEISGLSYSKSKISTSLKSYQHQLKLYLVPKNWQIEWTNEWYHSNDKSVSFTYFSDISTSYRTRTFEIGLTCNNLFGNKSIEYKYFTDYLQSHSITRLRPRELLAWLRISI